jgi:hypothetical protein
VTKSKRRRDHDPECSQPLDDVHLLAGRSCPIRGVSLQLEGIRDEHDGVVDMHAHYVRRAEGLTPAVIEAARDLAATMRGDVAPRLRMDARSAHDLSLILFDYLEGTAGTRDRDVRASRKRVRAVLADIGRAWGVTSP